MKKVLSLLAVLCLSAGLFVGCGSDSNSNTSDVSLRQIHEDIKKEYGDDYLPSVAIDNNMLKDTYGIDESWVDEVIAEGPMMTKHVDTFIAIKAKDGKADDVEKALKEHQQKLAADADNHPENAAKLKSAQVRRHGDYVFFVMLGKDKDLSGNSSSAGSSSAGSESGSVGSTVGDVAGDIEDGADHLLEFATGQVKRGIDIIDKAFSK